LIRHLSFVICHFSSPVMAQTKKEIQALLDQAGASPLPRFGQNFMIDGNLVRLVADAAEIGPGELIIEIGPGTGTLTDELVRTEADILAVEIDRNLAEMLRGRFAGNANFRLIEADALAGKHAINSELVEIIAAAKSQGKPVKLCANLPYNIASPVVVELLIAGVDLLAFTVQVEVAERLRAAGGKEYGPLSVVTQLLAEVELLRTLPPQAFWPMPKIESALVRLRRKDRLGNRAEEFSGFVHRVFSSRRKMMRKALELGGVEDAEGVLRETGIAGTVRPEEVSPGDWLKMFEIGSAGKS
jgi:16S rRNA (adenine1518-N6/adenine1519-N6)-dimethyltransferase